ncbi:MAG: flagellar basal body P-ring protein FlgI [Spirochaetia bacterium]|jgi:flagellar P-ring protein precursor FlgI|nr:flagellar basal body P-ring protein FlgI [Spirochaetia bacterium]
MSGTLKKTAAAFFLPLFALSSAFAELSVKVRELTTVDGLKDNQIYGYGLVTGLAGTGDSRFDFSGTTLENFIRNLGIEAEHFKSRNIAAVLVTAKLSPFVRTGDRIDVTVSSIGDAKSLDGGVLLQSPLSGADGNIYATAQGMLELNDSGGSRPRPVTGALASQGARKRPVKTSARISKGGIIERDITPNIVFRDNEQPDKEWIYLIIDDWDYGVADRIIKAVAQKYPSAEPALVPAGKIQLTVLKDVPLQEFIDGIQQIEIVPADRPRVVINEQDGTIVAGGNVQVSDALVSREGLIVEISGSRDKVSASFIKESTTVKDLVDALNAVGAGTADIISIMKALKNAGAIHAELIIQ